MINETLNLWGNGAVTLPKQWRSRFPETKHFMAEESPEGYLVIKPIVDVEYYEEADGSFGLRMPMGMEAGAFLSKVREADLSE